MNDPVGAFEIRLHDLGGVHHDRSVLDLDGDFLAVDRGDLSGLHISGHHLSGDDVVGKDRDELLLVLGLEERFDGSGGKLREGLVGRSEDRERSLARERLGQTGGLDRGDKGGEVLAPAAISTTVLDGVSAWAVEREIAKALKVARDARRMDFIGFSLGWIAIGAGRPIAAARTLATRIRLRSPSVRIYLDIFSTKL